MNTEERRQFLKDSIKAAAEERAYQDRIAALAQPAIEKILAQHQAETSKRLSCPHCNEPLPEGWRTDDVTSGTDNDDEDNEQDDDDTDDDDDDSDDRELDAAGKSKVVAEILKHRRR